MASKRERVIKIILILSIIGVFGYTCERSKPGKRNSNLPMSLDHVQAISVAISQMKYGLTGYQGYVKIHELFFPFSGNGDLGYDKSRIDAMIKEALNIQDVASKGLHYINHDIGMVNYYKLAFMIFGFNIKGTFYLYFLLLAIPILIFLMTFYHDQNLLYILLLFVASLCVILTSNHVVAENVTNHRFYPILAILPAFYLSLMILGKHNSTIMTISGSIIQTLVLVYSLHIRNSGEYQLVFLTSIAILGLLWYWKKTKTLKGVFKNITFVPLFLVLVCFFAQFIYMSLVTESTYNPTNMRHPFWHMVYMGLAANPEAESKYGISCFTDSVSVKLVERKAPELGYVFNFSEGTTKFAKGLRPDRDREIAMCGREYESILKNEFFKILKEDRWFVIKSFFYKFKLYFNLFFSIKYQGFVENMLKWPILLIIILNCCLLKKMSFNEWLCYFIIIVLEFLFSLAPILVTMPIGHSIMDSGLLLTEIIYFTFSAMLLFLIHSFWILLYYAQVRIRQKDETS